MKMKKYKNKYEKEFPRELCKTQFIQMAVSGEHIPVVPYVTVFRNGYNVQPE